MNPYAKETHFGVENFAPLHHPLENITIIQFMKPTKMYYLNIKPLKVA